MKKYLDLTSWFLLFFFAPFTVLVLLSQSTIPGDLFYPVKRGMENMILVAASVSPATKAAYRTDLTQQRFTEAQQLLVSRADPTAFNDFISEVNSTQRDISNISSTQDKIKNTDQLIAKIDQYQIQLSQVQNQVQTARSSVTVPVAPSAQATNSPAPAPVSGKFCVQVITYAKNPGNGSCQSFSTPCDVPDGWQSCSSSSSQASSTNQPIQTQTPVAPPTAQPFVPTSPFPSLAPTVSNEIATNVIKGAEVKNEISNTKEELQKVKEELQKQREEDQTKQKMQEDRKKLQQNRGENK